MIPFGQRAPSTMLGAHLLSFVLLYSSRLLIVLYSPNGVRVQTGTNGIQKLGGNDVPSSTHQYKRSTHEYKGIQTEFKNPRELTSRAVQTDYKRSTDWVQTEYKRIQTEYKRLQTEYTKLRDTTSLVQQIRTELIRTIAIATNRSMPRMYFLSN